METMRMLQKGQVKYISKEDVCVQNVFIDALFNVSAQEKWRAHSFTHQLYLK